MSSQENYDDCIFQILEVNKELIENNSEEKGINIVVGTLRNIRKYYQEEYNILDVNGQCVEDKDKFFNDYLPSPGVKVKTSFLGEEDQNTDLKYAEFSTVRFLLQCRRLSQMMTKTWLDNSVNLSCKEKQMNIEKNRIKLEKNRIKYMNKIFHLFNYKPPMTYLLKKNNNKIEQEKQDNLKGIYEYLEDEHVKKKQEEVSVQSASSVKNQDENKKKLSSYYLQDKQALILSLFLSGQAYIVDDKKKNFQRLHEPIFSTYELIWEYELDLSWDSYYAKREDIARPGCRQIIRQPNTRVTLGLPARPDYKLLTDDKIRRWVYAEERYGEKNAFSVDGKPEEGLSFYPEKGSREWENKQVKNVFPPYPYIILSCS